MNAVLDSRTSMVNKDSKFTAQQLIAKRFRMPTKGAFRNYVWFTGAGSLSVRFCSQGVGGSGMCSRVHVHYVILPIDKFR